MKGTFENSSPYIKLCILAMITFACAIVGTVLSTAYMLLSGNPDGAENLRILLLIQNSFLFIASPLIAQYFLWKEPLSKALHLQRAGLPLFLLGGAAIIVSAPFIDMLGTWNQGFHLPESLQPIEQWMIASEKQAEAITKQMLEIHSWGGFFMNLLVIALLAGVGEELLFRGVLQKIFIGWTKNIHAGVLITAFIFSAIHLQFFGFIPRFVLGALLGYLFVWSKSLWIPIFAHTLNNLFVILLTANSFNKNNAIIKAVEETPNSLWLTLISILLAIGCMYGVKVKANQKD